MPITTDEAQVVQRTSGTSYSFNHTIGATVNPALIVFLAGSVGISNPLVSYNGVSMSLIGSELTSNHKIWMFRLVAPSSGTNSIAVSWTTDLGGNTLFIHAISTYGVNQTTPERTPVKATGTSSPATVDTSSSTGELVLDCVMYHRVSGGGASMSVGGGQTLLTSDPAVDGVRVSGTSKEDGAGTVTMSWSTVGSNQQWSILAASLYPAPDINTNGNFLLLF